MMMNLNKSVFAGLLCLTAPLLAHTENTLPDYRSIADFMSGSIAQDTFGLYETEMAIKTKDIAQTQSAIWQLWKQVNADKQESKLIPLRPLSAAHKGLWKLPQKLEPNAQMPYYWGSKGQRPSEGYPLFLYLHGSGPKDAEWSTGLKLGLMFDDAPSVYFIPQIPQEGVYYRWWQKAKIYAWNRLLRQAFLTDSINPNRIYFLGISEGGYGSQRLAAYYADYLAAAGPMAGGEPLQNAPAENYMNLGYSMLTGAKDYGFYRHVLTQYTKEALDSLEHLYPGKYKHRIELIPEMGHGIDYRPTTPWLKTHIRNPQPKEFIWENFEMDGKYRRGFYNLVVLERSNDTPDKRTVYSMKIEGNRINLDIKNISYKIIEKDPDWGIPLKFRKHSTPVEKGEIILYLSDRLVNLDKKISVYVNGKKIFRGKANLSVAHLVNSCAIFQDPERLFPAAIRIDLQSI